MQATARKEQMCESREEAKGKVKWGQRQKRGCERRGRKEGEGEGEGEEKEKIIQGGDTAKKGVRYAQGKQEYRKRRGKLSVETRTVKY